MENFEKLFGTIQSVITVIGVVVGAIWTYILFIKNRQIRPKADVEHKIEIGKIKDKNFLIVTLHITIKNYGQVLLPIKSYIIDVQQLLPSKQVNNRIEGEYFLTNKCAEIGALEKLHQIQEDDSAYELEPTEKEVFTHILLLPNDIESIVIKSHFTDRQVNKIGWGATSVHNLT